MSDFSPRSGELLVEATALLALSTLLFFWADRYTALGVFPIVWIAAFLLRRSYRLSLVALTSHLLVVLIAAVRSEAGIEGIASVGVYADGVLPTNSSYLLIFWYLPVLYFVLQADVEGLLQRSTRRDVPRTNALRRGAIILSTVIVWRDRLVARYRTVIATLKFRGFDTGAFWAPLILVHRWLPQVASSIVIESIEFAEQSERFPFDYGNWNPQQTDRAIRIIPTLFRLTVFCAVAGFVWGLSAHDLRG